jgi:3-hydroxyisobutyrate dehydrogenase-like beta-hydroxyacid dehydrogenase
MTGSQPTVGFVGLGDQGLPMATAIAEAGYALQAWARRATSFNGLAKVPYTQHASIADLAAASDIVGVCVSTDEDVWNIVTGGLLDSMRPGSVIVNHGTGTPKNAERMAAACADWSVAFLDAPVSGGRPGAEARTLTTLTGGPAAVVRRCEPVFRSFSAHVVHLGGHGSGQLAKLFNNTLLMMNQANVADILELAVACGIDPIRLAEVLKLASGASTALELVPLRSPVSLEAAAAHLSEVELLDMEIFATAMTDLGVDAAASTVRAVSGAQRLGGVVRTLNP